MTRTETRTTPAPNHPMYHHWIDGFGIHHVRVSRNVVSPLILARRVLREEIQSRQAAPVRRAVYLHPVRVPDLDTPDTLVYREGE